MTARLRAFAGGTRTGHLNQALLELAVAEARDRGAQVTAIRLKDFALPLYDGDLEQTDFPASARDLKALLQAHHGFLIAAPAYNVSHSGVLNTAIDWASRTPDDETLTHLRALRGHERRLMPTPRQPRRGRPQTHHH